MNIAICDDEQLYADEIKKHVECYFTRREVPHKIYVFTDGQAAARSEVKFDIAFLDIEIGPVSGLDVGKAMRKNNPNIVFIVVTAFSKYLDDALDLKVLRFLEKADKQRKAICRYRPRHRHFKRYHGRLLPA